MNETRLINLLTSKGILDGKAGMVRHDGYLASVTSEAARDDSGKYCVYLWKHAWGEPFYVGSGVGKRWKSKNPRCDGFYSHIDAGDAVAYKVLDGVSEKTARRYECYVSVCLSSAGFALVNGDNNVGRVGAGTEKRLKSLCSKIEKEELTREVEKALMRIINHNPGCDYRITNAFLKEYGTDYFSRNFSSIAV